MGRLVVIEGVDGSGKQTLTQRLVERERAAGRRIATLGFPRYQVSVHAQLVRDALYGRLGDLSDSVYGCGLLFALDRRDAVPQIQELVRDNDIVLLDRYVSSNAAYGSARLGGPDRPTDFPTWVLHTEIERFRVPVPDLQILLATPTAVAAARALRRADAEPDRALDQFEADAGLQRRTAAVYERLAADGYLSRWRVLRPGEDAAGVLDPD